VVVPPIDHDCVLKDLVEDLANRLAKLEHENAQLKKAVLGSRSEKSKMPRIKTGASATPEERQKTRRERAATKAKAPTVTVEHKVPDDDVAYVFAEDRSGSTPKTLLEGTTGVLLVDGYSGYNVVDDVSTRRRAASYRHGDARAAPGRAHDRLHACRGKSAPACPAKGLRGWFNRSHHGLRSCKLLQKREP
jgi:hypothetical protein